MNRSLGDLSLDELDQLGQEAGAVAAEKTLDAGISTLSIVDGNALQVRPDRTVENLGPLRALDDPFAVVEPVAVRLRPKSRHSAQYTEVSQGALRAALPVQPAPKNLLPAVLAVLNKT